MISFSHIPCLKLLCIKILLSLSLFTIFTYTWFSMKVILLPIPVWIQINNLSHHAVAPSNINNMTFEDVWAYLGLASRQQNLSNTHISGLPIHWNRGGTTGSVVGRDDLSSLNELFSSILTIQTHGGERAENLGHLLDSLRRSRGIETSLLVISTDCDPGSGMDHVMRSIDFVPYILIRYPLSPQVFTTHFKSRIVDHVKTYRDILFSDPDPLVSVRAKQLLGDYVLACESRHEAILSQLDTLSSQNGKVPPRPSSMHTDNSSSPITSKWCLGLIKHHWWWKSNAIFGSGPGAIGLKISDENGHSVTYQTSTFNGPVVTLEEDYYVMPDLFEVLRLAKSTHIDPYNRDVYSRSKFITKSSRRRDVILVLSLGNYKALVDDLGKRGNKRLNPDPFGRPQDGRAMEQDVWRSAFHNMGIVFDKALWNLTLGSKGVPRWSETFCIYDDYNWDWTLTYMFRKLNIHAIIPKLPRIVHIGVCGVHQNTKSTQNTTNTCSPATIVNRLQKWIKEKTNNSILFPPTIDFVNRTKRSKDWGLKPNGGWNNVKDHELCLNITNTVGGINF